MQTPWVYPLRDLGEVRLPDRSPIQRPAVPLVLPTLQISRTSEVHLGVIDSGSPVSVTSMSFLRRAGIDTNAAPLMEVPLGLGGQFDRLPVFEIALGLLSPDGDEVEQWSFPVAARISWRFTFDVLLGQRGWFDAFTTTFGTDAVAVEPPGTFIERFQP